MVYSFYSLIFRYLFLIGTSRIIDPSDFRVNGIVVTDHGPLFPFSGLPLLVSVYGLRSNGVLETGIIFDLDDIISGGYRRDENSKFFHGIINRKDAELWLLKVLWLMANGWMIPVTCWRVSDAPEIEVPVMLCGAVERINLWTRKEFTFEFISKVWDTLGSDFASAAVEWFFRKNKQAMVFKVDFAKAYDSIRWDFLEDVLRAFVFGSKWCSWIRGCLHSVFSLLSAPSINLKEKSPSWSRDSKSWDVNAAAFIFCLVRL
ncbi:hypothetical protein Tco_1367301 [Tanacetum coccineum]